MALPAREDRRRQILAAATRVFARKGFHACRVGDIAKEAGVAYGLMYHYFSSKDELLETIFRDTWTQMVERIREVEDSNVPAREQVRRVSALVLRTWIRDPDLIRVLVREITRSPHLQEEVDEIGHAFAALERIVRRGQEQGELRADLEPRVAAYVFYGALEEILTGWVMGALPGKDEDVARAERAVVAILCDGLLTD
jgi:TetR/AcrR family fatty acid metabolism transcriptional regulator